MKRALGDEFLILHSSFFISAAQTAFSLSVPRRGEGDR
jgi:hypothetical protein